MQNLTQSLLEKSKLAQHAYKEGHRIGWNEARDLEIESNSTYRKYKESAQVACSANLISQPSLEIPPICIPVVSNEVSQVTRERWYDLIGPFWVSSCF
jgi:hypothetical protein